MINENILKYLLDSQDPILIPKKNVSMVFSDNTLLHAMLILKESNYAQIPVLDYDDNLIGLISIHQIFKNFNEKALTNLDEFDKYLVKDFVVKNYAYVKEDSHVEDVIKLLIDHNFVNVISNNGKFIGMITRSSILKKLNYLIHNTDEILKD